MSKPTLSRVHIATRRVAVWNRAIGMWTFVKVKKDFTTYKGKAYSLESAFTTALRRVRKTDKTIPAKGWGLGKPIRAASEKDFYQKLLLVK